jgi:hypothetical protein
MTRRKSTAATGRECAPSTAHHHAQRYRRLDLASFQKTEHASRIVRPSTDLAQPRDLWQSRFSPDKLTLSSSELAHADARRHATPTPKFTSIDE